MRRRLALAAISAAAVSAAAAAPAAAAPATILAGDPNPVAVNPDVFSAPSYDHEAGTVATLVWQGGGAHDADATAAGPDGEPLFRTELTRATLPVPGTQYLPLGSYPFICTIHEGMTSSLNVNAGTPLPRPALKLKPKGKSLDQVLRKAAAKVKVTIAGGSGEEAEIELRLGKKKVGKTRSTTKSGVLKIPLTKKGRAALAKRRKAKLKVRGTIDFGSPAKATAKLG